MRSRTCVVLGLASLLAAQAVASLVISPQRAEMTPNKDVYEALTPGEFAGTLMLGGFRGLACDLLWLRADSAKESGRFYESVALFQAISRIQPRFEQPWQFMSWDLAYNLSHEVEDRDAKWSWIIAGIDTNIQGYIRNPQSERLLRHLSWIFHHKGDLFHDKILAIDWAPRLNPVIAEINRQVKPEFQIKPFPPGAGLSNFAISSRLYQGCIVLADGRIDGRGYLSAQFVRRMVPLAVEADANLIRNEGRHRDALQRYIEALQAWEPVVAWGTAKTDDGQASQRKISMDSFDRNEGRLRRKAAQYCYDLAPDADTAQRTADAILARRWGDAEQQLAKSGWKTAAANARIKWLDEP